eukprot:TRINITY_DN37472_c0_g5_i1.p1 TRINITY_DN37472_c0_g5~~TRINITY_DN37472_c0_g5_i1.p1  ORF type:complete len:243 (+),score=14.38 TRINITY_DN37472_c0_g5_i1:106-834(+)
MKIVFSSREPSALYLSCRQLAKRYSEDQKIHKNRPWTCIPRFRSRCQQRLEKPNNLYGNACPQKCNLQSATSRRLQLDPAAPAQPSQPRRSISFGHEVVQPIPKAQGPSDAEFSSMTTSSPTDLRCPQIERVSCKFPGRILGYDSIFRSTAPSMVLRALVDLLTEGASLRESRLPAGGLAQDGRARSAHHDSLGVAENGGDVEASGALHVHEEAVGALNQPLELVDPLLMGGGGVQEIGRHD